MISAFRPNPLAWLLIAVISGGPAAQGDTPLGTAFTYQGRLDEGGAPADGTYEFQFILYDAAIGGNQEGPAIGPLDIAVNGGLLGAELDFGPAAFGGDARWLEIWVGGVPLAPRQPLTAAPYALGIRLPLVAASAANADVISVTSTGTSADCAQFNITDPTNPGEAVEARTAGTGDAVQAINTGAGRAAYFQTTNPANNVTAVRVDTNSNNAEASAIAGVNAGAGRAGYFQISNAANGTEALRVETNGAGGRGIYARTTGASGVTTAISGQSESTNGVGVVGTATGSGGYSIGVAGSSDSSNGIGVSGFALAATGNTVGVGGVTSSPAGKGVYGVGGGYGGYFQSDGATGVYGLGAEYGGHFESDGVFGVGVAGKATYAFTWNAGVTGESNSPDGYGVYGIASADSGSNVGVVGRSDSPDGTGVYGFATLHQGVFGEASGQNADGVVGRAEVGDYPVGVRGVCTGNGFAGYFSGNVHVTGSVSKSGGSFKIDHPLDPANKYLYHSFVESPDMMNIYNGNVVTGPDGHAWVELPDYFEALNRDFRYQLTVVGQFAQAIIAEKVQGNRFAIRTDKPGVEVSWQVTGVRQDPWAETHRMQVEPEKPNYARGKYLHPELYGQPDELGEPKSMAAVRAAEAQLDGRRPTPPDLNADLDLPPRTPPASAAHLEFLEE